MRTLKKRSQQIKIASPTMADKLDSLELKRCGTCWREWPAGQMIEEDGQDKCPECVDIRTPSYVARVGAEEADYAASRVLRPQISKVPLKSIFPPTIVSMTDVSGTAVSQVSRFLLHRLAPRTLILKGRGFTSSDVLAYSIGISDSSAVVTTPTQKTLILVADLGMTPGDNYGLTLNGVQYLNCISVR